MIAIPLITMLLASPGLTREWRWEWPIAGSHVVERAYIAPADRYSAGHRGIDITAPVDSVVLAPSDGEIYFVGVVVDRAVLTIKNVDGSLTSFEPINSSLAVGTLVLRGDTIGTVGTGKHCPTSCLHFGVRVAGEYVSPLRFLGGLRYPVLLPTRAVP
jgi:murein DD-endopeptidase MepM/ murein hydrolase activator NlpD